MGLRLRVSVRECGGGKEERCQAWRGEQVGRRGRSRPLHEEEFRARVFGNAAR